jgi:RimJ/RimL family protein N-acetyltransferase
MRLAIVAAGELGAQQLAAIDARIDASEHAHDRGACMFWHREGARPKLFVAVLPDSGTPIGIAHVDGPLHHVHAAWWLDCAFRGRGFGSGMIDALASTLKASGYTGVGRIAIDTFGGEYDAASAALARRFAAQFAARGKY